MNGFLNCINRFFRKQKKFDKKHQILGALLGLACGDALGVPVESMSRERLKHNPVKDMRGYEMHMQPPGTWSDDSSLTFCLAESLCDGFDTNDIGMKFIEFVEDSYWTPYGNVFDIGNITLAAINKIKEGTLAEMAGGTDIMSNGNGALMRILPLAFFLENYDEDKFDVIHRVATITHGHIISKIACSIYIEMAMNLLKGLNLKESYHKMQKSINEYYEKIDKDALKVFHKILVQNIASLKEKDIKSDSYVVNTLEAALWSFLNSRNYSQAVLTAVNLGDDTDTVGGIVGSLAGIFYGIDNIPKEWVELIPRGEDIEKLATRLYKSLYLEKSCHKDIVNEGFQFHGNINILTIADTHGFNAEIIKTIMNIPEGDYDVVFTLGDIPLDMLKYIKLHSKKEVYGVLGNHDTENLLVKADIKDLSKEILNINGISITGLGGSFKYKRTCIGYTHEESKEILSQKEKVDILVSHDTMYGLFKNKRVYDVAHQGLKGITDYMDNNKTKINIHGHYHRNTQLIKQGKKILSCYGLNLIKITGSSIVKKVLDQ